MSKILVVEDDKNVRKTISELLASADYNVITAKDGLKAVKCLESEIPDLVISDIMMPGLDGYQLLQHFRNMSTTITVPFIFLTAKSDITDIRKGMNIGADDYLTKPYRAKELLEAVQSKLEMKQKKDEKLDKVFGEIAANIPHELRTPLVSILGFSELVQEYIIDLSKSEILDMIERINISGKSLRKTIEKFIRYTEVRLKTETKSRTKITKSTNVSSAKSNIELITGNIIAEHQFQERANDITLNITDNAISISDDDFDFIIHELTENALKFSKPGSKVAIKGSIVNSNYEIEITDSGKGMTPQQIASIHAFNQHERNVYEQRGNGLGLITVKKLTEYNNGKFNIKSKKDKFTSCKISLPLN